MKTNTGSKTVPITEQTSSKMVNKAINTYGTAAGKADALAHDAAMLVMRHAHAFNDCSGAARLVNKMPKSHRRALMLKWFEINGPIVVEIKGGTATAHFAKDGSKRAIKFNFDQAAATPWFALPEADNEPGIFGYDEAVEAVDKLSKRLLRLSKGQGKSEVPEGDRATIAAIAAALSTLKMPERPVTTADNDETPAETPEVPVQKVA